MASIGELRESQGEIKIEWKIEDFHSLSHEIDTVYHSPKFYFSGASWQIRIYTNGQTEEKTEGWIGLYILRRSTGSALKLDYLLIVTTAKEKIGADISDTNAKFPKKDEGWGKSKFFARSEFMKMITNQATSDTLTITCALRNSDSCNVAGSLFTRHQALSDCLKEIYEEKKKTDCSLKVDGDKLLAHKMILQARSPVFAAMFNHDTKENQTGEISVIDIGMDTIETILMCMYSGDIDSPTTENVFSLYAAAEKYDMKEIKEICSEFIIGNFSEDWVIDVIKFNALYQNENLDRHTKDYFKENVRKILKTEKWKAFAKESPDISTELLSSVITSLVPE